MNNTLILRTQDNVVLKTLREEEVGILPRAGDILKVRMLDKVRSFRVLNVVLTVPYTGFTEITVVVL